MLCRCLLLTASLLFLSPVTADDWPTWRGPQADGVVSGGEFPLHWSEDENIVWKIPAPGWGTSTPIIHDGAVYLSAAETDGDNQLLRIDSAGQEVWTVELGQAVAGKNRKAGGANPSPVTDGELIWAYFKSGDIGCVTTDGSLVWHRNLQDDYGADQLNWDLGTSPVLTSTGVVIAVMHQGPSYLVTLDRRTGEEVWRTPRDLGAPAESRDSYSTPVVVNHGGREQLVVLGADFVTAYDAADGAELWRVGGLNPSQRRNFRSIASPAVNDGLVFAPYARGDSLTSIRMGGRGDVTSSHVVWSVDDNSADVPTPVAVDDRLYVCSDRGVITCFEAATGTIVWSETLPRNRHNYSASPVIVNDRLYATREDGTTFVLKLGDSPELIAENALREYTYATPAFADGHIYLRTSDWLFCIGE